MVAEDDNGVTINGLKMLGTATAFCHETWCGNLQPVAPGQEKVRDAVRAFLESHHVKELTEAVARSTARSWRASISGSIASRMTFSLTSPKRSFSLLSCSS